MARLGKTLLFQKRVRDALLEHFPVEFTADLERPPQIKQVTEWGERYLWVSLVKGGLLHLSFGVIFKSFSEVDRTINGPRPVGWQDRSFGMTSLNMRQMAGLPYPQRFPLNDNSDEGHWLCDTNDPPSGLAQRLVGFIQGVVFPFYNRFVSLQAVRESLVQDDGWLMLCGMEDVLLIDIALNDKAHFDSYIRDNSENQNFQMALQKVPLLLEKFPEFASQAHGVEYQDRRK